MDDQHNQHDKNNQSDEKIPWMPSQFPSVPPGGIEPPSEGAMGTIEGATEDEHEDSFSQPPPRRRRKLNVDIGTPVTDYDGYLLRNRPGCDVPVSPTDALLLSEGFLPRDIALLRATEQLGIVTTEQLARAFFNSPRSAYKRLLTLAGRRFLARISADAAAIRSATESWNMNGDHPRKNPAYVLDWNGYYLLTVHHSYQARNWRAATAAVVTSRFGHTLGISEVWSYLVAAARATHEIDLTLGIDSAHEDPCCYRLSVGLLNERQSLLTTKRAAELRSGAVTGALGEISTATEPDWPSAISTSKALLQPDATLVVAIRELSQGRRHGVSGATVAVPDGVGAVAQPVAQPDDLPTREARPSRPTNPRWNPTLGSWDRAVLRNIPSPAVMVASEKPGNLIYRSLLLEMETGSNNRKDSISKVTAYSRLVRTNERAWLGAYGVSPRVLVVVRTDDQVEPQASIWRAHYSIQEETSVLVASLQTLARAYSGGKDCGRRALIEQPCWFDVMAASRSAWKTLGEALYIRSVVDRQQDRQQE